MEFGRRATQEREQYTLAPTSAARRLTSLPQVSHERTTYVVRSTPVRDADTLSRLSEHAREQYWRTAARGPVAVNATPHIWQVRSWDAAAPSAREHATEQNFALFDGLVRNSTEQR